MPLFYFNAGLHRGGETALDWAVWKGSAALASLLLAAGAHPTPAHPHGCNHRGGDSAAEAAIQPGAAKAAAVASEGPSEGPSEDPRGYSSLHRASLAGDARALEASAAALSSRLFSWHLLTSLHACLNASRSLSSLQVPFRSFSVFLGVCICARVCAWCYSGKRSMARLASLSPFTS